MSDQILDIKSLISESKGGTLDYPGLSGFKLKLSFLSRETLTKIRKKATVITFKRGASVETVNDDTFLQLYTEAAIKGWEGLTLGHLSTLAPIPEVAKEDTDKTVAYSPSNAFMMMKSSADFDSFVSDAVTDLQNFRNASGTK